MCAVCYSMPSRRRRALTGCGRGQVAEVRSVLAGLAGEYATRLRTFVALLPTQTPVDLNFLLFRLEAGKGDAAAA